MIGIHLNDDAAVFDPDALDPGIRRTVMALRVSGFRTTDSGDGVSKPDMACALPVPNVYMVVDAPVMVAEADRLLVVLTDLVKPGTLEATEMADGHEVMRVTIEASYCPTDGVAILALHGVSDADLLETVPT